MSVVIAVYNADKYIDEAIRSCLSQTHQDIEIIIVNDGSTDNTASIINEYAQKYHHIKVFHQENKGVGAARNQGNSMASSEFIAVLDADDIMLKDRLEEQFLFLKQNLEVDAVSCWANYINERGKKIGDCISPTDLHVIADYDRYIKDDRPFMGIIHSGMMYRKSAVLSVGGYRNMRPGQDTDLWNRMAEHGLKILVMQKILIQYRIYQGEGNTSAGIKTLYTSQWLQELIYQRKHGIQEVSFERYMEDIERKPAIQKWDIKRKIYAKYYFKHAALRLGRKKYLAFIGSILMAGMLDFNMVFSRLKKQLFFNRKGHT